MDRIIITGATGFIGSHITRVFCENGVGVGCLVRKSSSLANIEGLRVDLHYGNILDMESLEKAFRGYDWIIHNAAKAVDWGKYKDFYDTNVTGTLNILKTAKKLGIKNIIMTSSNSVYGEENNLSIKDESYPYNSHYKYFADRIFPCALNYYRDTKALAKKAAIDFAKENDLNLTLIEPVFVYGEREFNTGFYEYIKTAKTGIPFLPGSKKNKFHVVYAEDLANAYFLVFKKRLKGIDSILIGNQEAERMDKIYSLFCKEAGIKKPWNIRKGIIYPVGLLLEFLYTIFNSKKPPTLTRGRVNMFYDNNEFSIKKAEQLLGFKNKYTLEMGIKKTVQWYKENGFL